MNKINLKFTDNIYLDLGCGDKEHNRLFFNDLIDEKLNYVGIDIIDYDQSIVWDVRNGIPLPDNFCNTIIASHFVEHFNKREFIDLMNECWRILKPKCILYIITPHQNREESGWPVHLLNPNKETFYFFEKVDDLKIKNWQIKECVLNKRKDIHIKLIPKK